MDPREIVDAYLHGRIESWGVFRRLTRLGLSTATALAVAAALPAAVRANDAEALKEVGQSAPELPVLDLLMSHLASPLEKVEACRSIRPLAVTPARIARHNLTVSNDCNSAYAADQVERQRQPQQYQLRGPANGQPDERRPVVSESVAPSIRAPSFAADAAGGRNTSIDGSTNYVGISARCC